jgi:hypothetical protein
LQRSPSFSLEAVVITRFPNVPKNKQSFSEVLFSYGGGEQEE